jgi:hypothetical protein
MLYQENKPSFVIVLASYAGRFQLKKQSGNEKGKLQKWIDDNFSGAGPDVWKKIWRYIRMPSVFVALTGLTLHFLKVNTADADNIRYLLSAIAQGLATVYVLTITIPLLIMPFFIEDNIRERWLKYELNIVQLTFYGIFAFSVILPLILLATGNFSPWLVKLCCGLTAGCLYGTIESALGIKLKVEMIGDWLRKQKRVKIEE